ncbi:MAG: ABC transporter ATP-binding protein [Chloroflexaceae bacterium]|nr:ABC transporter ATP-binding protein [Chloroflexaceae bacterium]
MNAPDHTPNRSEHATTPLARASNGQTPHLHVQDVSKQFVTRKKGNLLVLDQVSIHVELNELVSIVGTSGSGKSTLLRIIAGLLHATSGVVCIDGQPVTGPGPDRGMIFQHDTLYPWLSVAANVEYGLKLQGVSRNERRDQAAYYVQMVGLDKFAHALPHQLSGGMKQRVAIARALANHPQLLLMDEPFGSLDAHTRTEMQQFLLRIWRETHTSILLVTHDVPEAVFLSQRVYVFSPRPGRVKTEIAIPFDTERSFGIRRTSTFHQLEWQLLDLLQQEHYEPSPPA